MITCGTQIVSGSTGGGGASAPAGTGVVTASGGAFVDPVASAATTRTTLGLGGAAVLAVGTSAGTVAAGDDSRITGAIAASLLTTRGDIITRGASAPQRLAIGANGYVLTSDGTDAAWAAAGGGGSGNATSIQGVAVDATAPTAGQAVVYDGTKYIPTTVSGALPARRTPVDANSRLRWEFQGSSGTLTNTGTLGSAGDLTAGGTTVRAVQKPASTIGLGISTLATSASQATGAAGQTVGTTAVTLWAIFTLDTVPGGAVPIICRDFNVSGWAAPYVAAALFASPTSVFSAFSISGTYRDATASVTWTAGAQYVVVATYDGATIRTYRNGALVASGAYAGSVTWGSGSPLWHVGGNGNSEYSAITALQAGAEQAVWSASDIATHYVRAIGNLQ